METTKSLINAGFILISPTADEEEVSGTPSFIHQEGLEQPTIKAIKSTSILPRKVLQEESISVHPMHLNHGANSISSSPIIKSPPSKSPWEINPKILKQTARKSTKSAVSNNVPSKNNALLVGVDKISKQMARISTSSTAINVAEENDPLQRLVGVDFLPLDSSLTRLFVQKYVN